MKKKILVVDDEAGLLKAILIRLNNLGYEAFGGVDGQEALALARQRMPDLIILDVSLPKVDGDEIATLIKKNEKLKHIPIILISAMAETLKKKAKKIGASGYFSKPLEMEELLSRVEKYLPATRVDPLMKKILVIDDDLADRKKLVFSLEKVGYPVMEASTIYEAILKARQRLPDLVIVDVVTQDSNITGFDICRRIRSTFQPNPPLVLMVTGKGEGVSNSLADKMGAAGFEIKTKDMARVVEAVRNILVNQADTAGSEGKIPGVAQAVKVVQNIFSRNGS